MGFQWDPRKNAANMAKHGVDSEDAIGVFQNPFLEWQDTRKGYGERRFVVIGMVDSVTLTVVHAERGNDRRIVSARRASRYERKLYRSAFPATPEEGQD